MKWSYRCEWVKCGKDRCSCAAGAGHGPYWYRYRKQKGKLHKEYIGRNLADRAEADQAEADRPKEPPIRFPAEWLFMLSEATASARLARAVLGIALGATRDQAKAAYNSRIKATHPDRGGDEREAKCVIASWSYLRSVYAW